MLQFPHRLTIDTFSQHFEEIKALLQAMTYIPIDESKSKFIFHRQLLKSSLFSARIEGNTLTLPTISDLEDNPKEKNKKEVSNTLKALQKVISLPSNISLSDITNLHSIVMSKIDDNAGKIRRESSAIFDQFGNIVYITPSRDDTEHMLEELITQVNSHSYSDWREQLILIAACHYYFEKTHPFLDGNGRTGRVLMHYQLQKRQELKGVFLPIDQYFDEHRSEYYHFLEKNSRNISGFAGFFLKAVVWSLHQFLSDIKTIHMVTADKGKKVLELLPRRQEILALIKDHPMITLDSISRRFPTIPKRTIAYDLQQLHNSGLIIKHGATRGVVYSSE